MSERSFIRTRPPGHTALFNLLIFRASGLVPVICLLLFFPHVAAQTYALPENPQDSLVGELPQDVYFTQAKSSDTLLDVARRYDIGQNEIMLLNPDVDRWLPGKGTSVRIPNSRVLPDTPRQGLTLNLPEFRMYYFPADNKSTQPGSVITHPISIGRQDWNTPLGTTRITGKKENPTWTPPESIRKEHAAKGEILPAVVPAGPDNPLGLFAMYLGLPGYLIHSTNKPYGVGLRVSHGCIRMYPEDIETLFPQVKVGTPVHIVNQPIKVGWRDNTLYIEVYPPLEDEEQNYAELLEAAMDLIEKANDGQIPVINGAVLREALERHQGFPIAIYQRPAQLEQLQSL